MSETISKPEYTKAKLCREYKISYTTLRKWLAPLIKKGMLPRLKGSPRVSKLTPNEYEVITKHLDVN